MAKLGWIYFAVLPILIALIYSWRKGTNVAHHLLTEYDFIIVGAGSAGSVLASRLSEDHNVSVLLLEAGGDDSGDILVSTPLLNALTLRSHVDWGFYTISQKHSSRDYVENKTHFPRGKCLGGSSSINSMIYTRGSRYDFDGWAEQGCHGWSYREVLPYFLKSENILIKGLARSGYHSRGGELPVTSEKVSSLQDLIINAGRELGYKEVDYNGKDMIGVSYTQGSITRNGLRASTSRVFLRPVMNRPNLHISINSYAHKILIDGKKATGVLVSKNGGLHEIKARQEVLLSAGTIKSPQLLMLSGIGPKRHLEEHGIEVISDLPVGNNFQDHLYAVVSTHLNNTDLLNTYNLLTPSSIWNYLVHGKGWFRNTGVITSVAFLQLDDTMKKLKPGFPDTQFHVVPVMYQSDPKTVTKTFDLKPEIEEQLFKSSKRANGRAGFVILANVAHPKSRGSVYLQSKDPMAHPVIDPNYFSHSHDIALAIKGLREAVRFLKTKVMRHLGADPDEPNLQHAKCESQHMYNSDEYWECYIRASAVTVYHAVGTCKMGSFDNPNAVVDETLRVKGIKGLRVVDASIMPTITSGNTNAPTIMIAEKASDMIRGVDSVVHLRRKVEKLLKET